ncbi:MAG: hypothetical protein ABSG76_18660 [Xanthobacteraceae bacterium]
MTAHSTSHRRPRASRTLGLVAAALLVLILRPWAAVAGESAALTRQIAESGNWRDGERTLADRLTADPADDEARFGLGMVRFIAAVEAFGQHHYRFGLKTPEVLQLPFLRLPVPLNLKPDVLTYDLQRAALQSFLDRLAAVEATLADIRDPDLKIVIDLERTRLDFRGSGTADPDATLMSVVRSVSPMAMPRQVKRPVAFEVAFDRGDAIWLRGYCHLLSAGLEFVLAYDWRDTFTDAGGLFYPRIGAPDRAGTGSPSWTAENREIANAVAMIHRIRWEPTEPARLAKVRDHLKRVVGLSRDSWKAILSETDDDREWIPAPGQKDGVLPGMAVTQERLDTWLSALDEFDAALDGRKLVPHWVLEKGINLRRVLEEPRTFDLVLWATGHAAAPYLEDGPMIKADTWRLWQRVFQGDFLSFAAYFN